MATNSLKGRLETEAIEVAKKIGAQEEDLARLRKEHKILMKALKELSDG